MSKPDEEFRIIRLPDDFVERGYQEAFGETAEQAQAKGTCVKCKQPPVFKTEAGRREFGISGLCEACWDELMTPPDEPGGDPSPEGG